MLDLDSVLIHFKDDVLNFLKHCSRTNLGEMIRKWIYLKIHFLWPYLGTCACLHYSSDITSNKWHSPAKMTSRSRKGFQFYPEQSKQEYKNAKFLIFLEIPDLE